MMRIWCGGILVGLAMVLPQGTEASTLSEEAYAAIQTAFLQEEFESVIRLAQPLLAQSPLPAAAGAQADKTIRVWLWYVLSLERLKQSSEALRELDRLKVALSNLPAAASGGVWPEVLFWEGEISRKANQVVRAKVAYQRVLANFPDSSWRPQAQLGLGRVLLHQQAYEEARLQFHEVRRGSPSSQIARETLLLEGLCHLQLKRYLEALPLFRQLLGQPLDSVLRAQALFYLGEALTGLGQFEEATTAYRQAIEADPDSPWAHVAHFGLGWSTFQANRCRESLEAFAGYLKQDHLDHRAELLFAQGRCLMALGDETPALANFEELRKFKPEHPLAIDAAISMAQLLERQHRFSEAVATLEPVFRQVLEPIQRTQAHLRLGSVYLAQGQALKAAAQFHLAKETKEADLRQAALNGLGDVQSFLGDPQEAVRLYEEAIRLDSTSQGGLYATYQLGRLRLEAGRVMEAIEVFQQLANQSEGDLAADARLALALAYLTSSQNDLARIELKRVREQGSMSPQAARAGYYLALLEVHEGRDLEARRLCNEVIRSVPQSDEALEAHLLLADLEASQASPQEAFATLKRAFGSLQSLTGRHRGKVAKKFGDFARQAHELSQAIYWYEAAWEALPALRGELDYRIASCYEEAGDVSVALHRYRGITQGTLDGRPTSQSLWQTRGQLAAAKLMERQEQWQEAMHIYEAIVRQGVPEAKIAKERLAALGSTVGSR